MQELWEAIKNLPKGKAPGEDGILTEVFQTLWSIIGEDIKAWILEVLESRSIDTSLNSSKIVRIPKKGDKFLLTNYCPISFLGTPYKILVKTLTNRLKQHLDSWIVPSQTTFVQGRSIFDSVLMANEDISWAEESNQNLVILLLDFEKAFDRVSWNFLQASMLQLGFDTKWIS